MWETYIDHYGASTLRPVKDEQGDLFSSETTNGMHAPCLDLDFDCELLESSTPGHYHLLINKETTWDNYQKLLSALLDCGYIERGWYHEALNSHASFVRQPGVWKQQYDELKKHIEETGDILSSFDTPV